MSEYFFFHDRMICVWGCACQVACKDRNNLSAGEFFRRVVMAEAEDACGAVHMARYQSVKQKELRKNVTDVLILDGRGKIQPVWARVSARA